MTDQLPTAIYDKDGIRAVFRRPDRMALLKRDMMTKTLRNLYPDARYAGDDVLDRELADDLNNSFFQVTQILTMALSLSGLPYGIPGVKDAETLNAAYEHFMTDAGQALYGEWTELCAGLLEPLTTAEQKREGALTADERADPLSVAPVSISTVGSDSD